MTMVWDWIAVTCLITWLIYSLELLVDQGVETDDFFKFIFILFLKSEQFFINF